MRTKKSNLQLLCAILLWMAFAPGVMAAESPVSAGTASADLPSLADLKKWTPQQRDQARGTLEAAAKAGNADAMIRLAHLLWSPLNGGYSEGPRAVYWFERAYLSGRKEVCSNLGWAYLDGALDRRVEVSMAVDWFTKGIELGDAGSELSLGWLHLEGRGVKQDFDAGFKLIQRAADKGYPQALRNLGRLYAHDSLPMLPPWQPDYAKAASLYQAAIDKGDQDAVTRLAQLRLSGRVVTTDADQEASVRQAMQSGRVDPIVWLARLIESGKATARNEEEAPVHLYYQAAAGGSREAMQALATAYRSGKNVPKDLLVTAHYEATIHLRSRTTFLPGSDPELAPHMARYLAAATAKDSGPALELGNRYWEGRDFQPSNFEAYVWFAHAARTGNAAAVAAQAKAKAKLSELELSRAGARIANLADQADNPWERIPKK